MTKKAETKTAKSNAAAEDAAIVDQLDHRLESDLEKEAVNDLNEASKDGADTETTVHKPVAPVNDHPSNDDQVVKPELKGRDQLPKPQYEQAGIDNQTRREMSDEEILKTDEDYQRQQQQNH